MPTEKRRLHLILAFGWLVVGKSNLGHNWDQIILYTFLNRFCSLRKLIIITEFYNYVTFWTVLCFICLCVLPNVIIDFLLIWYLINFLIRIVLFGQCPCFSMPWCRYQTWVSLISYGSIILLLGLILFLGISIMLYLILDVL